VSAHAKLVAMIALDCDLMNSDHVGPVRSRVGSIPAARRIFQKVDAASWWPSRASSPWMRLIPSSGSRAREANGNASDLGVIWRASSGRGWRLGPVPCDESLVPSQHCFGFDDQKRCLSSRVVESAAEESEDCSIGFVESWPVNLTLKNQDLVPECEDLGIA
jgi:hypothetical protein